MATVVRVKRHRSDDPAEKLVIACKKNRVERRNEEECEEVVKEVFKFAGTVSGKNVSLQKHLDTAMHKERLAREYKLHIPSDKKEDVRCSRISHAKEERFQLSLTHRSADLPSELAAACQSGEVKTADMLSLAGCADTKSEQPLYHLVDAIPEQASSVQGVEIDAHEKQEESVTCNGVVMVKEKLRNCPPLSQTLSSGASCNAEESDFVYDIYFTNRADFDFRLLESVLRVEAYNSDSVLENATDEADEEAYDCEDDSNDEGNWRNDYPDEDPRFCENDGLSDCESEDRDEAFDADPMMEYFTNKCNLDATNDLGSDERFACEELEPMATIVQRWYAGENRQEIKKACEDFDITDSEGESSSGDSDSAA